MIQLDAAMPILGESVVIDLANTWYVHPDGVNDYLADINLARTWLRAASVRITDTPPTVRSTEDLAALRGLRTTVRRVLEAVADSRRPESWDVADLNRHASAARSDRILVWPSDGVADIQFRYRGDRSSVLRSFLAHETVNVLAARAPVLRCEHPTCLMLFIRDHRKRRFCHPGCSHRYRQARYSHSRRPQPPSVGERR